jgi:hypothetical protein
MHASKPHLSNSLTGLFNDSPAFRSRYGGLCRLGAKTAYFLRIEKVWGSGSSFLEDCSPGPGVDRCLRMRGTPALSQLIARVPELTGPRACLVITHAARGFKAADRNPRDDWPQLDFTDEFHVLASAFLARAALLGGPAAGERRSVLTERSRSSGLPPQVPPPPGPRPGAHQTSAPQRYASLHLRTEKWPEATASRVECWASLASLAAAALAKQRLKVLFVGADLGHSFSYSGLRSRQALVAARLQEEFVAPLQAMGYRVLLGSDCSVKEQLDASPCFSYFLSRAFCRSVAPKFRRRVRWSTSSRSPAPPSSCTSTTPNRRRAPAPGPGPALASGFCATGSGSIGPLFPLVALRRS